MTLLAAFQCWDGAVICADSQETYGDYRVTVDKIRPRNAGNYELVIGGAGNTASLIDGLANAIEQNVSRWPMLVGGEDARFRLERVLIAYHVRQVKYYPAEENEKLLRFIIAIRDKSNFKVSLWKTDGTTVERIKDYALLGWEEALYEEQVKRLYYYNMWAEQAAILGIHLFTVAQNSLYIGGPTQVIVMKHHDLRGPTPTYTRPDVEKMSALIQEAQRMAGSIVLQCLDAGMPDDGFLLNVGDTIEAIVRLRRRSLGSGADFETALANLPKEPDYPFRVTTGDLLKMYFTDIECMLELQKVVRRYWGIRYRAEQESERRVSGEGEAE